MIDRRIIIGLFFVLITMGTMMYAGLDEQHRMEVAAKSQKAKAIQTGAVLYEENCSECHGPDGQGVLGRAPTLNSAHFFDGRLKELGYAGTLSSFVELTVAGGRPVSSDPGAYSEVMPTWGNQYGGPLRPDQVRDVTAFVLNWENEVDRPWDTAAMDAAEPIDDPFVRGMNLFNSSGCSACHVAGSYANGQVGPDVTNLYAEQGEEYVRESIWDPNAVISPNCPTGPCSANVMPQNFSELLTEEQLDDLVAFIQGLSEGR
ncbi:MAG: c-type cytochrome [Chloroflexota bacterium]